MGLVRDLEGRLEPYVRRHLAATLPIHTNVLETVSYSVSISLLAAPVHPKMYFYNTRFKMGRNDAWCARFQSIDCSRRVRTCLATWVGHNSSSRDYSTDVRKQKEAGDTFRLCRRTFSKSTKAPRYKLDLRIPLSSLWNRVQQIESFNRTLIQKPSRTQGLKSALFRHVPFAYQ